MKKATFFLLSFFVLLAFALALAATRQKRILFTCTTFFDFAKQDRWATFCRAMDSILAQHTPQSLSKIHTWLIVNEYSPEPKKDWSVLLKERYPFMRLIQKGPEAKGQARSMNIILSEVPNYDYWIHWEDTWYARSPFLDRALDVMDETNITQLQLTQLRDKPNWLDSQNHPHTCSATSSGTAYCLIFPSPRTFEFLARDAHEVKGEFYRHWPLYSLLPSINRCRQYRFGGFSTDPTLWPVKFEWDFGRRWIRAGCTKGVLPDGPVIRDNKNHVSTYTK